VRLSRCRSCNAEIVWCKTEAGKMMPVDAVPDFEKGSIVLRPQPPVVGGKQAPPLAIQHVSSAQMPDDDLYTSHFATCPDAKKWRRGAAA